MSETLPVKQSGIGLAFIDDLTREQKKEIVLAYITDWLRPIEKEANAALEASKSFAINSQDDLLRATASREALRGEVKEIEEFHESRLSPSKKDIRDCELKLNKVKNILQEAQKNFDQKIGDAYLLEESGRAAAEATLGVVLPQTPKTIKADDSGVSIRKDIEIVITDFPELIKAIAAAMFPNFFLVADTAYIKKWCKMMGKTESDIPGVQIKQTAVVAGRSTK